MALNKTIVVDKCEVVSLGSTYTTNNWKVLQVRTATIIDEDGTEVTRSFERFVLNPGTLDASDNLVDNPLDKEPDGTTAIADEVKSVCNAVWTDAIKASWKAKLIADKAALS